MRDALHHELLYRGAETLQKLRQARLTVCGAGAVGSNLVNNLARQGMRQITVIDFDRVEPHNIGTQIYCEADVGAFKVEALQAEIFRAAGIEIAIQRQRLTERNVARLLSGADLVVDGFDNHLSRRLATEHCRAAGVACLHVGLRADYAEVLWNEGYRAPQDVGADVCDYPLSRNVVQFAVAIACEAIVRFLAAGERQNYSFTLGDLRVNREVT